MSGILLLALLIWISFRIVLTHFEVNVTIEGWTTTHPVMKSDIFLHAEVSSNMMQVHN